MVKPSPEEKPMQAYTLEDFHREFPDEKACLEWLKNERWKDGIFCETCGKITSHYYIASRKSFCCQTCGNHVHPTANTIFHKSSTPLKQWFYAIYRIGQTGGKISAKQLERELGVTYKTAWRMHKLILQRLSEPD